MMELLSGQSVRGASNDLTEQHKEKIDVIHDGHMLKLHNRNVAYKIKSELNMQGRLTLMSAHMSDPMQLRAEERKLKDPYLRNAGDDLRAEMYTESALLGLPKRKKKTDKRVGHLDGTGRVCEEPQDFSGKLIMLCTFLTKHDVELLKLAEVITCKHNQPSLSIWLINIRAFVEESNIPGAHWPILDIVVIGWSWVLTHSLMFAWNIMTIDEYLEIMYKYCLLKKSPPHGIILVLICYGHFMHLVSRSIDKNFVEYKVEKSRKRYILECISAMALSRTLKELDTIFELLATLLLAKSKAIAEGSEINLSTVTARHASTFKEVHNVMDPPDESLEEEILREDLQSDAIYANSPFYRRYVEKEHKVVAFLESRKDTGPVTNEFYDPLL
ncbi:hypothetical protein QAD02_021837 [Eretmocerus hayati]|uniref:Uncharacterized protein n=1 Tax=Eretmocerus hayati TaxID=131215 RepID=A0ACC2PTU3_9HYME|nr:hypothetical protein QAD02_021837 [Eretmocerus hayati]